MQARKESLWRNLLGVAYALTVVLTPGEGQPSIGLGGHEWVDAAVSGMIGLVAVPPVLLGTAYGIWKENQLDKEVWQMIDERGQRANRSRPVKFKTSSGKAQQAREMLLQLLYGQGGTSAGLCPWEAPVGTRGPLRNLPQIRPGISGG